jgi:hypothetical protein
MSAPILEELARMRRRGNALESILPFGMKQMLKAVVEVQYTTGTLEVAG